MAPSSRVRLLLLQARLPDDPMAEHEHQCFVRATGLPPEDVVVHDLTAGPPTIERVRRHDALTVGGSGDFYVSKGDLPRQDELLDVMREVVEAGHPTFASCFGYQLMVLALGGEIIYDPVNTEVGSFELELTAEGRDDPLFGVLPARFWAQFGHKDRAARHPDGVPNLARSERSPFQALRIVGKPVWASQFHPELDRETNEDRFRYYRSGYAVYMSEEEQAETASRFRDSPETSSLLPRFLRLVFG